MAPKKETYVFKWKIENFSFCAHDKGKKLESPEFSPGLLADIKWKLGLCPRGINAKCANYVSCFLRKYSDDDQFIEVEYELNTLKEDGSNILPSKITNFIFRDVVGNGTFEFIEREKLSLMPETYLPRDTLTVQCTFSASRVSSPPALEAQIQETYFEGILDVDLTEAESVALSRELVWKTQCGPVEWEARTVIEVQQMSVEYFGFLSERCVPIVAANSYFPSLLVLMNLETAKEKTVQIIISEIDKKSSSFAKCKLCFLDTIEGELLESEYEHFFAQSSPDDWKINVNFDKANGGFLSHPVKVTFNFRISADNKEHSWFEDIKYKTWLPLYTESALPSSAEDTLNMYVNQELCDFTLVTNDAVEFPAHKVVLGMRSPVFKAMLKHDMREARENRVVVSDVDAKTLDLFLKYMYSLILPNVDYTDAQKLYCVAEKYQVLNLKEHCSKIIDSHLDLSTAYEILCFSDLHQDNALKNTVVNFVYRHSSEVFISDTWLSLIDTHPQLVSEVLRWISVKSSNK